MVINYLGQRTAAATMNEISTENFTAEQAAIAVESLWKGQHTVKGLESQV